MNASKNSGRLRGFVSYAGADRPVVDRLMAYLRPIEREFDIEFRIDSGIAPGSDWNAELAAAIDAASIFIVCLSPDYLASRFVHEKELPAIGRRVETAGALMLPVILKPCAWWGVVGDFQVAPRRDRRIVPISNWKRRDDGLHESAIEIRDAVQHRLRSKATNDERSEANAPSIVPDLEDLAILGPSTHSIADIRDAVKSVIDRRLAKSGF